MYEKQNLPISDFSEEAFEEYEIYLLTDELQSNKEYLQNIEEYFYSSLKPAQQIVYLGFIRALVNRFGKLITIGYTIGGLENTRKANSNTK